jgi:hypothetical protein
MVPPEDDLNDPYEDAPWSPVREILSDEGFIPIPSKQVSDFELRGRLWQLLYALAAKRIYFFYTDHFSDREFYAWLEKHWLPGNAARLPENSEWNCHVDVSEYGDGAMASDELFLKYYADDEIRAEIQKDAPETQLPPRVPRPYHRDAFLPRPHAPTPHDLLNEERSADETDSAEGDYFVDEEVDEDAEEDDPLGLAAIDREINRQRRQPPSPPTSKHTTLYAIREDLQEWLEEILEKQSEHAGHRCVRPLDLFREFRYAPLPLAELTDETIAAALWELLHELSRIRLFLCHTDHLSDEQLYALLTQQVLHEKQLIPEVMAVACCYHDFLRDDDPRSEEIWLRYYATESDREIWAEDHPQTKLPEKKTPPFHRDWQLPKRPLEA